MPSRNAKNRRSRKQKAGTRPQKAKLLSAVRSTTGRGCCISDAATKYLKCLVDPITGPLVGVPDGSIVMTHKSRIWARSTFTCAASGSLDACVVLNVAGLFNNTSYCVYAAQPLSVQTINTPAAGGFLSLSSNAPYGTANFGTGNTQGLHARVVSAKLRLRYLGTELNKGGYIAGIQEPNHASLAGKTVGTMLNFSEGKRVSINQMKNGEWFELDYLPSDVNDTYFINGYSGTTAYDGVYTSDGVTTLEDAKPFIAAYINNPVASAPFEVEAWGVVEYAGPNVRTKTVTIPDTQGFHAVLASVNAVLQTALTSPETMASGSLSSPGLLNKIYQGANDLMTSVMPQIMDVGSRYAPSVAAAAARGALNWLGGSRVPNVPVGMPRLTWNAMTEPIHY